MARRLPPLNAVRAFEAAARHLSFTRAADELHVTQAAISHQVKLLEDRIGVRLFRRLNRALVLTEAGQALLPPLRDGLDRIAGAFDALARRDSGGVLTVSTVASFAAKWLVSRLPRFQERHPHIEVRLSTSVALVDFDRDDVDVAVRMGAGRWPGVVAHPLFRDEVFPVCSPKLLERGHPLRRPEDLRRHVLLHDEFPIDWATWLRAAGVDGVDPARGPRFTDSAIVLQAAIEGQGVALGRRVLVADDLAAGRLVAPFAGTIPTRYDYFVVAPARAFDRPKVAAFRDWLVGEAVASGLGEDMRGTEPAGGPAPLATAGGGDQYPASSTIADAP